MRRQFIIFGFALAILLGSVVTVLAALQDRDYQLRGYADATRESNLPYRLPRLGVNAELTQYSSEGLSQQLERMETAHITWVRQIARWDQIEPQPGQFDWTTWDQIVGEFDSHPNLRLVAVLMNTPVWVRHTQATDQTTAPPSDPAQLAAFAHAFASRYAQSIDYYQVWDEPNLADAWGGLEPRPAEYLAILQAAYEAIHAADESAMVLMAALAPTIETGPQNISDIIFLRDLYTLGAQPFMDAVAAKPYGFDTSASDRRVDSNVLNFSHVVALREVMLENGDGRTPLWAGNWGWNSLPDDWIGKPSIWGSVTGEEQIAFTLAGLDRASREWPWLGGLILQHWQPDAPPDDPVWGFALIDRQNRPTPLYNALVQRALEQYAENGLFHPQTPFARYSGVWTFGRMGADIGWLNDSQFEFDFIGRDVALLVRQDDYVGYLYPTVDGQPANAVPRDASGNAYVVLTSGSRTPETRLIPIARGLGFGQHTLHVRADRGWDRWALAGYAVSSGNLAAPFEHLIGVGWLAVLVTAGGAVAAGWSLPWRRVFRPIAGLGQRINDTGQIVISVITSLALMLGMLLTWGDAVPNVFRREPVQVGLALLTAGLIRLEPGFVITALAALALFVIVYNRHDLGLMLVVFWSPFFLFPVELYRFAFPMSELIVLITGAAWVLRLLAQWGRRRHQNSVAGIPLASFPARVNALDYGVAAWLVLGFVSLLWTEYRQQALTELRVMMIEPALFYLILRTSRPERKTLVRLIDTLVIAGSVVALIGLVLFFSGQSIITAEEGARRLASVYGSPNNVGLFLGRCTPFALAFALIPTDTARRMIMGTMLAVMGLAVILSQSVGALFVGVPASAIAVLLLARGKRALPALAVLIPLAAIIVVISLQSARFARVLDFNSGTNFFRIRVWQSALNVIGDHPVTGLGLDQFLYAFRGQYIMPDAWQEPDLSHPHNFMLDFWVRLGIFGVAIFIGLQVAFWQYGRRLYHRFRISDPLFLAVTVGMMGSMINLLAHGLIDNSVYVHDLVYVFVLLLGVVSQLSNARAIDEPRL